MSSNPTADPHPRLARLDTTARQSARPRASQPASQRLPPTALFSHGRDISRSSILPLERQAVAEQEEEQRLRQKQQKQQYQQDQPQQQLPQAHPPGSIFSGPRPSLIAQSRATQGKRDADFRADALWAEMQRTLADVELSAMNSSHVFSSEHTQALEELRTAQLGLAHAWAKSDADDITGLKGKTGAGAGIGTKGWDFTDDGEGDGEDGTRFGPKNASLDATSGMMGTSSHNHSHNQQNHPTKNDANTDSPNPTPGVSGHSRGKSGTTNKDRDKHQDHKSPHTGNSGNNSPKPGTGPRPSTPAANVAAEAGSTGKTLLEETERDIEMARKRREANDRYFEQVNRGVLDVVSKLDEVAVAMRKVEKESREIWSDDSSSNDTGADTDAPENNHTGNYKRQGRGMDDPDSEVDTTTIGTGGTPDSMTWDRKSRRSETQGTPTKNNRTPTKGDRGRK